MVFICACHRTCAPEHTLCQICHQSFRRRTLPTPWDIIWWRYGTQGRTLFEKESGQNPPLGPSRESLPQDLQRVAGVFFFFFELWALLHLIFFFFCCLIVGIKPEKPYFASVCGFEVKPLGVYPLGLYSYFCGPTKGTPLPRNTLRANWG